MQLIHRRLLAVLYGGLCHGLFLLAVCGMAIGIYTGMQSGLGRLEGASAFVANAALVLQFPVLHSLLLTGAGRRWMARLAPLGLGRTLSPTTFVILASLQLIATFVLWSPSGVTLWEPSGGWLVVHVAVFVGSWLFLNKALLDSGLGLQTGWIGWTAAWSDSRPSYPGLPQRGLFAICRQPIYLGFALVLWTGPVWTPDHLAIAGVWGLYCLAGPVLKERRFAALHGESFQRYRERVPYFLPKISS